MVSFVEWEHKVLLLLHGISVDELLGFLENKIVVAAWNCHWSLLPVDACFEDFHLPLLPMKAYFEVLSSGKLGEGSLMKWLVAVEN